VIEGYAFTSTTCANGDVACYDTLETTTLRGVVATRCMRSLGLSSAFKRAAVDKPVGTIGRVVLACLLQLAAGLTALDLYSADGSPTSRADWMGSLDENKKLTELSILYALRPDYRQVLCRPLS
jgi:hypothetical protein